MPLKRVKARHALCTRTFGVFSIFVFFSLRLPISSSAVRGLHIPPRRGSYREKRKCVCGGEGRLEFTLLPVHAQKALQ